MILLGVSGKRGSGKDTLADILVKKYGFIKKSFAEELKSAVRRDFNLTNLHTDGKLKEHMIDMVKSKYYASNGMIQTEYWTPRSIMIAYGQFFRQFDPLWWVKKVFEKLPPTSSNFGHGDTRVIVSDVRFENEANYIRNLGGSILRLERKPELNIYGPKQIDDISETSLDNYLPDFRLSETQNINKEDLSMFADHIMHKAIPC